MEMSLCSFLCSSTLGISILLILGGSGCTFSSYQSRNCLSLVAGSLCFSCQSLGTQEKSTMYKKLYSLRQLYFNCMCLIGQEQYEMGKEEMRSTLLRMWKCHFTEVNLGFVHYLAHSYCLNSDSCCLMNYTFNFF